MNVILFFLFIIPLNSECSDKNKHDDKHFGIAACPPLKLRYENILTTYNIAKNNNPDFIELEPINLHSFDIDDACDSTSQLITLLRHNNISCNIIFSMQIEALEDAVAMARRARYIGVPFVLIDASFPNIGKILPLYKDPQQVYAIVSKMNQILYTKSNPISIIVKVGNFTDFEQKSMETLIKAVVQAGGYALLGPTRTDSMTTTPSDDIAYNFVKRAREIITKNGYPLALFACGSASTPAQQKALFDVGADGVFCDTSCINGHLLHSPKQSKL
jgi:hypothetical protein